MRLLIDDAWRAKKWQDKLRIWFMPTGWRPVDVAEKFPVYKIDNVNRFKKYSPASSRLLYTWSWVQTIILLLFISYLFGNIGKIGSPNIFIYGGFVFLCVYAYTELMDRSAYALIWEFAKCAMGIWIVYYLGDWFGASQYIPWTSTLVIAYLMLSLCITAFFIFIDFKKKAATLSAKIAA